MRWFALVMTVLMALVYAGNVPFYAGASLGLEHSWRMEQGRLTIRGHEPAEPDPFYLHVNSNGLRFSWENGQHPNGDWWLTMPLWSPLFLCLIWLYLSWSAARENAAKAT